MRLREAEPAYQLHLCSNVFRDLTVVPHQPLVTSDETSLSGYPEPPVEPSSRAQAEGSLPFESLMVRVPHHDPEHGGSIFLTTLSLSMGRRARAGLRVSLSRTLSASNRFMALTAPEPYLMLPNENFLDRLMWDRG